MKKNLLTIVILALLLVNIALTAVMMISVTTTNNKTANLVTTIATVMNLELTGGPGTEETGGTPPPTLADTEIYAIPEATIPLQVEITEDGKEKQPYMVCEVSLQINKKHPDYKDMNPLVEGSLSMIKDAIRSVISSKTVDECRDNEEQLKAEILTKIQSLFGGSDFIYGVSFGEVKFG